MNDRTSALWSTMGGTLLNIAMSVDAADWLKSCLLAATGAVVSFLVSRMMKKLFEHRRNKP